MIIDIYGGAESINKNDMFEIGVKNSTYILKELKLRNINPRIKEVGGYISRTVSISVENGITKMKTQKTIY